MRPLIFLDTSIPIYAAGRPHPLKVPCARVLELVAEAPDTFVTDAEVLQELLHRYLALRLWVPEGRTVFRHFVELVRERVEPVRGEDVETAASMADQGWSLSARDLLHLAVMRRLGVHQIVSADGDFDRAPGAERLDPADVDVWRRQLPI